VALRESRVQRVGGLCELSAVEQAFELSSKYGSAVKLFSLGSFDAAPDLLQFAADSGATTAVDLAGSDDIALVHYTIPAARLVEAKAHLAGDVQPKM
jgi:hypothetical protein